MKKIILLVVLSFAVFNFLVACGNNQATQDAEQGEVVLTVWTDGKEDEFTRKQDELFQEMHPNIKFNKVVKSQDAGNDFAQAVAAGNAPDYLTISFTMMDKLMKAELLEPLDAYIDTWDDRANFYDKYIQMFQRNNKTYGIPHRIYAMLFGYNKRLFEQAGLSEPPKTWEQALEYAKILTVPENQQYGYALLAGQWTEWWFQYYVWQAGGDLTQRNSDDTLTLTFTDPAVIKAAEYYKELRENKVTQNDVTLTSSDLIKEFAAGKCAMMPFAGDWVPQVVSMGMKIEDIGLAEFPAGPAGLTTSAVAGNTYAINAKISQAKKDAAWQVIKFNSSRDNVIEQYKYDQSKGAVNLSATSRNDISLSEIIDVEPEFDTVLKNALANNRDEFYAKATVGKYVDKAVQKIIVDPSADPMLEFEKMQEAAQKEVVENFNQSVANE